MFFKPVLKDYIWGGRKLEKYGRNLPETGNIAESWEISGHEDGMTLVENGAYAGKSLQEILNLLGEGLVGKNNRWALERGKFPLLVKLIDAHRRLSVQVHPDDDYALAHEGDELGKTEMWVVLEAEPNAEIIYGLSKKTDPNELQKAIDHNQLSDFINSVPIKTGDHVCVPSGTLHAILEGAVMVEVQQNSNTTYRVYDWDRINEDGEHRALHIKKSLDVINFQQVDLSLPEPVIIEKQDDRVVERLCQNSYFTTDRISLTKGTTFSGYCDGSTLEIWGVLIGAIELEGQLIKGVRFVLLPAAFGAYKITASTDSLLLRTYVA